MKVAEYKAYLENFFEVFEMRTKTIAPTGPDYQEGGCFEGITWREHRLYVKVKKTDTEWILLSWTAAGEPPSVAWQRGYTWHKMKAKGLMARLDKPSA